MAKQGMKRTDPELKKNDLPPLPEADQMFHSPLYRGNDLAIDNLLNGFDMTPTDVREFWQKW